ncbi:uncharacterized protein LOC124366789 [Homalodisca vitripennis]|uniref:uncharacterized protein LOC124366789 n=1 Tax=Homalodisca vitripennis TaxID=197043 RepID=UPI001EEB7D9D|nr:uncharacterized protein LOC124366789 [Homalodisca vitripennis]
MPEKPLSKTVDDLVKLIQEHLYAKPSFIAERYKFSKRNQREGKTVAEYIACLKKLLAYSEFGAALNDYARGRLSGIKSESTKQGLLGDYLDLRVGGENRSVEAAGKNAETLTVNGGVSGGSRVQGIAAQHHPQATDGGGSSPGHNAAHEVQFLCWGQYGHYRKQWKLFGVVCHKCGQETIYLRYADLLKSVIHQKLISVQKR